MHNLRTLHLFAGSGGGILADKLLGFHTVGAVEIDSYCQQVLSSRQKDGVIPWFPIFDDVKTFDGKPWKGLVDVVCGGFPCNDISQAGRRAGIEGRHSSLWMEMSRVVSEIQPRFVFIENSRMLVTRGLSKVVENLAEMGYASRWCVLGADAVGLPHKRERLWLVADSKGFDGWTRNKDSDSVYAWKSGTIASKIHEDDWPEVAARLCRVDDVVASRLDRIRAIGNGWIPDVAALAWSILTSGALAPGP